MIMTAYKCLALCLTLLVQNVLTNKPTTNDLVIIGVLAQFPYKDPHQYIAASYVKFLESSGARVVPVFSGHPYDYYETLLKKINGILLPGGGSPLDQGPYAEAVNNIFQVATKLNKNGTHFPIWASCLSFEMMIVHYLGNRNFSWEKLCHVQNLSLNLEIEQDVIDQPNKTQLFKHKDDFVPNILDILRTKNVTANYHRICIEVDEWNKHKELTDNFRIISHNKFGNYTFVSTVEHRELPFFASAWHPEKNQFEFVINKHHGNINHDQWAVLTSQYFANVFVNEARKNCAHFHDKLEESQHLIYNYNQYREYTGSDGKSSYEEVFKFPTEVNGIQEQQKGFRFALIISIISSLIIIIRFR